VLTRKLVDTLEFGEESILDHKVSYIFAQLLSLVSDWECNVRSVAQVPQSQFAGKRALIHLLQEAAPEHIGYLIGGCNHCMYDGIQI